MKTELTKQFVKKTCIKIIIFTFVMIVISAIGNSVGTIVANEFAVAQMLNSNEAFVMMNMCNNIFHRVANIAHVCVILCFVVSIGRDTYTFVKTINTENNKEN